MSSGNFQQLNVEFTMFDDDMCISEAISYGGVVLDYIILRRVWLYLAQVYLIKRSLSVESTGKIWHIVKD